MRAGEVTLLLRKLVGQRGTERHKTISGLFDKTYAEMKRIAARLIRRHPQRISQTDLVHEASLRLLNSAEDLENSGHFYGSAENAMKNALVDEWRRVSSRKRGGEYVIEALGAVEPAIPARSDTLRFDLLRAVDALPYESRRLFELIYIEGRTCREAAAALGISERVLERRLQALRATLRSKLSPRSST